MPSVGSVKIPIISTFDPAGIVAAKAGMRDLSQTKVGSQGGGSSGSSAGGSGGGGSGGQSSYAKEADQIFERTRTSNEKYEYQVRKLDDLHKRGAISTNTYNRAIKQAGDTLPKSPGMKLGLRQAGQTLADQMGLGGITGALGAGGVVAGAALAGVAIYGLSQKIAGQAIALKDNARAMGVSSQYYAGLSVAANRAGTSAETVTRSLMSIHDMAKGARTGDVGASLFFKSMGISQSDIQGKGVDEISAMMLRGATNEQKAQRFGSVTAANAIAGANGPQPWYTPTVGLNTSAAQMKSNLGNMGTTVGGAAAGAWQYYAPGWLGGDRKAGESIAEHKARKTSEGTVQEQADNKTKFEQAQRERGQSVVPGLIAPKELAKEQKETDAEIFKAFGNKAARYKKLHEINIDQQQLSAESPFLRAREIYERQDRLITQKGMAGGYSSDRQRIEAGILNREQADNSLSSVRSNAENIQASFSRGSERWGNSRANIGEKQDIARSMGDKLTDYAESITRSGSLAGAYDVNSVAGYSQQVGSEYQMDQSKDTLNLIAQLLQKLVDKTPEGQSLFTSVMDNLGFRTADPILGGR